MFYRITKLPAEAIDEFLELYQKKFGLILDKKTAEKKALKLINLFNEFNKNINKNKEKYENQHR